MEDSGRSGMSRRRLLGACAAGMAVAAMPRDLAASSAPGSEAPFGDAHAHLFNLADLPARGFFEHAILWNTQLSWKPMRRFWPAILDLIEFMKDEAISAEKELRSGPRRSEPSPDISRADYDKLTGQRLTGMARQSRRYRRRDRPETDPSPSPEQVRLRDSYYALARLTDIFTDLDWSPPTDVKFTIPKLSQADLARIARNAARADRRKCPEAPKPPTNLRLVEIVRSILTWAWTMMQSRQYHLQLYRRHAAAAGGKPVALVNLLVDYDSWLGDGPHPRSSHDVQTELWSRIRKTHIDSLDLRTFAGFDPLKDAEEWEALRDRYGESSSFSRRRRDLEKGLIHGFKLYPPMGFRPIANHRWMFEGEGRSLDVVRDRWDATGLKWDELPLRLDAALRRFYHYCASRSVPVLAHAFHSNESSRCSAARAGPRGWLEVVREFPALRLCLAHFADAGDFEIGMDRLLENRPVPERVWPLRGAEELLQYSDRGLAHVYYDIGDMNEFLHPTKGEARAAKFFGTLRRYCELYDPRCEHLMYGSDWIMLAREARNDEYLTRIRNALAEAEWPAIWRQNFLHDNLKRFLGAVGSGLLPGPPPSGR